MQQALSNAYEIGRKDKLKEVAQDLRDSIFKGFKNSGKLPWPPSDDFLRKTNVLPSKLQSFLCHLLPCKERQPSERTKRLRESIGQDICRAVTNSEWKLPKHILLCMTLRHLFRSKELITLINRFGHSESHSFSLELETAIANSLQESSSLLTNQIVRQPCSKSVFHSEFDNFDQLVNDMSGQGSVHTAHGIMLQEVSKDNEQSCNNLPQRERIKQRSWEVLQDNQLAEVYVSHRKSPTLKILR